MRRQRSVRDVGKSLQLLVMARCDLRVKVNQRKAR